MELEDALNLGLPPHHVSQCSNGEHIVFCDVMLSNDEGERYVQGTAQVALPSRAA